MLYSNKQQHEDYNKIEKAIHFIQDNFKSQPSLEEIADNVHLSKYHFNRMFKRWAGISPVQFLQFITLDHTKKELSKSKSVLEASLDSGLSGPSRLHDLFVNFDAMTPGDFKKQGAGLNIEYGFCSSPFGECLMAITKRGICYFGFVEENHQDMLDQLFKAWPDAVFIENSLAIVPAVAQIFDADKVQETRPFNLLIKGTNFQVNVWKALLKIPSGSLASYQDIAEYMGKPKAFRAVANAIAKNPVAYLIPCHRVIAKSGQIHQYRWGAARKKALVGWEAADEYNLRSERLSDS
ncbi:bifunctional transcriptional activator/DNA repair enzyme AdaA [Maridesulfovibrio frigidus]|uniref:bifunctional transcriptional activator/DNA repair enzyme AdaA n=1 Tax=Maridesulfovibrio frigidus TaxID=340956 RepID=UPI000550D483|nr:methylated-DNA--[protein]-cysteine S-methyltransferase [Maridesulfovibrio frigidus]